MAATGREPDFPVLLLAAGADDAREFAATLLWPKNSGSARNWAFAAQTTATLKGCSIALSMSIVLRDGWSINALPRRRLT